MQSRLFLWRLFFHNHILPQNIMDFHSFFNISQLCTAVIVLETNIEVLFFFLFEFRVSILLERLSIKSVLTSLPYDLIHSHSEWREEETGPYFHQGGLSTNSSGWILNQTRRQHLIVLLTTKSIIANSAVLISRPVAGFVLYLLSELLD